MSILLMCMDQKCIIWYRRVCVSDLLSLVRAPARSNMWIREITDCRQSIEMSTCANCIRCAKHPVQSTRLHYPERVVSWIFLKWQNSIHLHHIILLEMNHLKLVMTTIAPFIDEVGVPVGTKRVNGAYIFTISNLSCNNPILTPLLNQDQHCKTFSVDMHRADCIFSTYQQPLC